MINVTIKKSPRMTRLERVKARHKHICFDKPLGRVPVKTESREISKGYDIHEFYTGQIAIKCDNELQYENLKTLALTRPELTDMNFGYCSGWNVAFVREGCFELIQKYEGEYLFYGNFTPEIVPYNQVKGVQE